MKIFNYCNKIDFFNFESILTKKINFYFFSLSISTGALYIRKYFDEDSKKKALEMVQDIREEFKKILEELDWMDETTKKAALEKAASMSTHIAYPDELLDNKKLEEFYENVRPK